jgi:hypothetical protein
MVCLDLYGSGMYLTIIYRTGQLYCPIINYFAGGAPVFWGVLSIIFGDGHSLSGVLNPGSRSGVVWGVIIKTIPPLVRRCPWGVPLLILNLDQNDERMMTEHQALRESDVSSGITMGIFYAHLEPVMVQESSNRQRNLSVVRRSLFNYFCEGRCLGRCN